MAPTWLTALAWAYLAICFCCAALVAADIAVLKHRQPMGVMNFVFPITALYFGPLALWFYWRWGRAGRSGARMGQRQPRWVTMATEVSHCGAGCTLGDVISEVLIFALALTIAGTTLWAEYAGD